MYSNRIFCTVATVIVVNAQSSDSKASKRLLRGSAAPVMRNDDGAASASLASFGPLEKLLGTWQGHRGINVVSLPQHNSASDLAADFIVLGHEYNETLTFSPIWGQVLNRGYSHANQLNPIDQLDQVLMGVTYDLRIKNSASGELLHAENGQWLWNKASGIDPQWTVTRAGIVPHGVSLVALGDVSSLKGGDMKHELEAMSESIHWAASPQNMGSAPLGYFEGKRAAGCKGKAGSPSQGDCSSPVGRLLEDIGSVQNMSAIKLQVSSVPSGGALSMLPNIKAQVENKAFNATFFVETINDSQGQSYQQLQYAQNVFLAFETNFACRVHPVTQDCSYNEPLILWPHIQVNTLRKIEEMPVLESMPQLPQIR